MPPTLRSSTASDIIRRLNKEVRSVGGIQLYMQPVQDLTIDTTVSSTQYQFMLEDANPDELNLWTPKLVGKLQQLPQFEDVDSNLQENGLSDYVTVDRNTAGRLGITLATVDNALYDSFGKRIVSTIFTESNQYRVILDTPNTPDALNAIYLPSAGGGQVPIQTIATVTPQTAPLQ